MHAWLQKGRDVYEMGGPVVTIGRDEANDIILTADVVSRIHALVYQKDGEFFARDLGSRNGTSLNGVRITEDTALQHGDVLRVGFELTFHVGDTLPEGRLLARRNTDVYRRTTGSFPAGAKETPANGAARA